MQARVSTPVLVVDNAADMAVTASRKGKHMKFRKPLKITSRTSSITNSFVQAIVPSFPPTAEERRQALEVLDMSDQKIECAYCGATATDWDHLRPLVRNKLPTGYINEMRNLVPSCGPCNQSKSGADWKDWMLGSAIGSPTTRKIADIARRIERLEKFAEWGNVEPLALRELAGADRWDAYWKHLFAIERAMIAAQQEALEVRSAIHQALGERSGSTQRQSGDDTVAPAGILISPAAS